MRVTIHEMEQRSPEWHLIRAGKLTGTGAEAILAEGKKGAEAFTRRDLRSRLACERVTGLSQESSFTSKEMEWGVECEPRAFAAIEARTGDMLEKSGFIELNGWPAGCSLDAHSDGLKRIVELKCPKSATHLAYFREQRIPPEYVRQITHNLWVTGAQTVTFASYDPRFEPRLQLFLLNADRSEFDIGAYEAAALQFLSEVDAEVRQIKALAEAASG